MLDAKVRPLNPLSLPSARSTADAEFMQTPETSRQRNFLSLPPELHVAVVELLAFPDALALKYTNRHFYSLINIPLELKVDWLLQHRITHQACSKDKCRLGNVLRLCRGSVP